MATRTLADAEAALKSGGLTGRTLDMALTSLRNSYGNTNVSTPPQSTGVRNLQLSSGDPASSLTQTANASSQVAQTADPYTIFNQQLTQMLTRQQALGTKRFQEQGINAQQAQNDRISAAPPSDLAGASPSLQDSVRSANANALQPTIDQARNAQQTFGEQVNSYGNALDSARQLVASQQAQQDKQRDDARAVIKDALTLGGADSLNQLSPDELKQLEKLAGYPAGYVQGLSATIKEREIELKRQNDQANIALKQRKAASGGSSSSVSKSHATQILDSGIVDSNGQLVYNGRGSDGYVDPGAYTYAYENWNGTQAQFLAAFPPKKEVNPASYGALPAAIRPTGGTGSRGF